MDIEESPHLTSLAEAPEARQSRRRPLAPKPARLLANRNPFTVTPMLLARFRVAVIRLPMSRDVCPALPQAFRTT